MRLELAALVALRLAAASIAVNGVPSACSVPVSARWWYAMVVILAYDQLLRHTRWNPDMRPYYPPREIADAIRGIDPELRRG